MKEVVEAQRSYFQTGETRNVDIRIRNLKRLQRAIADYEERIYKALWDDLHKSAYESYLAEIAMVLQEIRHHIRHLRKWAKPLRVSTPLHLFGSKSCIVHEPLGVVLIIAPWNYPFQLLINPLVGALAAGNCAVLKPSPYTPRVSEVMAEMIGSIFAPGYVTVIQGGKEENQALLAERFDYIFFTGSPEFGKAVMKAAAEHLTPVPWNWEVKVPVLWMRMPTLIVPPGALPGENA